MDEEVYRRLKQIARLKRRAPTAMVREALAEYTARHAPRRKPRSVGAFRSGRRDIARRAETLLAGFGKPR